MMYFWFEDGAVVILLTLLRKQWLEYVAWGAVTMASFELALEFARRISLT